VCAATPAGYPWYRLYPSCEFDGLRAVALQADAQPSMVVVAGDWQAKLVLAALAGNASRIWYMHDFFTAPKARDGVLGMAAQQGRPILAVTDSYLKGGKPAPDLGFLRDPPWRPVGAWPCAGAGGTARGVDAYEAYGVKP
jgi:hypothetical protein